MIPKNVAAAIQKAWPDGIVEQFDRDESYFERIHSTLRASLATVPGGGHFWETEDRHHHHGFDDDDDDY